MTTESANPHIERARKWLDYIRTTPHRKDFEEVSLAAEFEEVRREALRDVFKKPLGEMEAELREAGVWEIAYRLSPH